MIKYSIYKNFYKNILANDLGIGFPIQNIYKIPSLQRITMHNTSHAPLSKRGEIFSPWAASLVIGGRRGNLLVSKRSVSGFKLKENSLLGCSFSLRGEVLYQFLDKFLLETLPRELSNRPENWTPAMEWESIYSVGEFFFPCRGGKTVFPAAFPLKMEPLKMEPLKMEPLKMEPLKMEPLKMEPLKMEPLKMEPASSMSAKQPNADNPLSVGFFFGAASLPSLGRGVTPRLDERKEKTGLDIASITRGESSQHSYFLSPIEVQKKLSSQNKGVKSLSKEYNFGVSFCFSFRDLESSFHLFEYLRGFDITLLFSTSFKISFQKG
jgi:hypothetical protein